MNDRKRVQSSLPILGSKDLRESRERVDTAVKIIKEGRFLSRADFDEALKKVRQRNSKAKSSLR